MRNAAIVSRIWLIQDAHSRSVLALVLLVVSSSALGHAGAAGAPPLLPPTSELDIMRTLRQALHDADSLWAGSLLGWSPDSPAHPCTWEHVECDRHKRVTAILLPIAADRTRKSAPPSPGSQSPLLPELCQLEWLETLRLGHMGYQVPGAIPDQWVQPGAFPRLQELVLSAAGLEHPLPDIPPGALPFLAELRLAVKAMQTTLPASWGARPDVLPALHTLSLELAFQGPLPAAWAGGFRQLEHLSITRFLATKLLPGAALPGPVPGAQHPGDSRKGTSAELVPLPAEWAAPSSFPRLETLALQGCGPAGTIPAAWLEGGFPSLTMLGLQHMGLAGTLPAQMFAHFSNLSSLNLENNSFSGTLPDAWSKARIKLLILDYNNLTGPAFPDAWLLPGALPELEWLDLKGQARLAGTLPADLNWPKLVGLNMHGMSSLTGSIPEAWCLAPFAHTLRRLWIGGTGVDPTPPACALTRLPVLEVHVEVEPALNKTSAEPTPPRTRTAAAPLGSVSTLLAACILIAVLYLRRYLRRRWHVPRHQQPGDAAILLGSSSGASARSSAAASAEAAGASSWNSAAASAGGSRSSGLSSLQLSKRARLAALLRAELGRQAEALRLLPTEALPEALAHHLGAGGSQQGLPAQQQGQLTHSVVAELARQQAGKPRLHSAAGRGSEVEMSRLATWSSAAASSSSSSSGWHWGLDTQSLLVSPGDLTFVTDSDGQLVSLGAGTHGAVFLARLQGIKVAVKVYELLPGMDSQAAWQEAKLLHNCVHPRIVPLLGVALQGPLLMLAMEWMQGGSLRAALQSPDTRARLAWGQCGRQVAVDIAEALAYMHSTVQVLHGDLKSSNVLLSPEPRGHVADLGLAKWVGGASCTAPGGTRMYAAPEQLMGQRCTLAADIYALGVVLIELTTRELASSRGQWRLPRAPHECPQEVVELISECIQSNPQHRPTAAAALGRLQAAGSRQRHLSASPLQVASDPL